jgi:hypothetical protein
MRTPGKRVFLVGEWRRVGIGVERSTRSSENSFKFAGLISVSDSVRGFGVFVLVLMNDHLVYSRSWIWRRY